MGVFDLSHTLLPADVNGDQEVDTTMMSEVYPFVSTPPVNIILQALSRWEAGPQLFHYFNEEGREVLEPAKGGMYELSQLAAVDLNQVSVKSDDAVAPAHLWDARIWNQVPVDGSSREAYQTSHGGLDPLDAIRTFGLRYWRRVVTKSLLD